MYRRHLHEMESSSKGGAHQQQQQSSTAAGTNKTGIRTIDAISEIPVVNSALSNVTEYYGKVKERNMLLRTSLNLAELSVSVMSLAATPITSLCKKPIESVDSYLYEKLNDLEHSYPSITKPTEQITESAKLQVKQIYNQTLKQPIDRFNNFKDITTNKVNEVIKVGTDSIDSIKSYGCDQINRSAALGVRMVDACLESSLAKLFTDPVLNFTENALDFFIPESTSANGAIKSSVAQQQLVPGTTLRRIYDINSRVYRHVYQYTFVQLNKIHVQFEATIKKLQSLKQLSDAFYSGSRDRFVKTMQSVGSNSLVTQCLSVVNRNNLSLDKMEVFMRTSYRAILEDVAQMVEKYMSLVKNFPVTFNGTKIRQTIESLVSQLNKESFAVILTFSIDQLKTINASLVSYTNQMFQVVNNSRLANLLKSTPGKANSKAIANNNNSTQQQQQQPATSTKTSTLAVDNYDTKQQNNTKTTTPLTSPFTSPISPLANSSDDTTTTTTATATAEPTTTTTNSPRTSVTVPPPTPATKLAQQATTASTTTHSNNSSLSHLVALKLGDESSKMLAKKREHNDDYNDEDDDEENELDDEKDFKSPSLSPAPQNYPPLDSESTSNSSSSSSTTATSSKSSASSSSSSSDSDLDEQQSSTAGVAGGHDHDDDDDDDEDDEHKSSKKMASKAPKSNSSSSIDRPTLNTHSSN